MNIEESSGQEIFHFLRLAEAEGWKWVAFDMRKAGRY